MLVGDDDLAHVVHGVDGCLICLASQRIAKLVQHLEGMSDLTSLDRIGQRIAIDGQTTVLLDRQTNLGKIRGEAVCDLAHVTEQISTGFLGIGIPIRGIDDAVVGGYEGLDIVCDRIRAWFKTDQSLLPGLTHAIQRHGEHVVDRERI